MLRNQILSGGNIMFKKFILPFLIAVTLVGCDDDDDKKPRIGNPPACFDAPAYLILNDDVAKAGVGAWEHYVTSGKAEKRPPYYGVDCDNSKPPPTNFNTGRIIYIDDMVTSLSAGFHGDANGPQDLLFTLALGLHKNQLPMAIGVTSTTKGLDNHVAGKIVALSGLDIPVLYGHRIDHSGRSELSDFIVRESKKGKLTIAMGGAAGDVAQAVKQGANKANITLVGTLFGTSNELRSGGAREAAKYLKGKIKIINIGSPEYRVLIDEMPVAGNGDENKLIKDNRSIRAWDAVFSPAIMKHAAELNLLQSRKGRKHNIPLRISDFMNFDRALSGSPATYKGYKNYTAIMNRAKAGFNIMRDLKPLPVKPKPPTKPTRKLYTAADYRGKPVIVGLGANPNNWPVTSKITRAEISSHKTILDHTKKNVWKGKFHSKDANGRDVIVNGNLSYRFISGGKVIQWPVDHFRPGQIRKGIGCSSIEHKTVGKHKIEYMPGDVIGVMAHTQARVGTLANGKERTAVKFIKCK